MNRIAIALSIATTFAAGCGVTHLLRPALAHAEMHAALGQNVQGRDPLRHLDRMVGSVERADRPDAANACNAAGPEGVFADAVRGDDEMAGMADIVGEDRGAEAGRQGDAAIVAGTGRRRRGGGLRLRAGR